MTLFEKWALKRVKAQTGDFSDWTAINKWAADMADELKK
jgi:hypothetical protein